MSGKRTETIRREKVALLKKSADAGEAEAQFQMGLAYFFGDGVEENESTAALWFKRAAKQDHLEALYKWGNCLYFGTGVKRNHEQAFGEYLRGANLGNLNCQYATAVCYASGHGIEQDWTLAHYWMRRGGEHNHAGCQNAIGACLMLGYGVDQDLDTAKEWLTKAAQKNYVDALLNLGYLYLNFPPIRDPLEAAQAYRKGAELGHAECQFKLGMLILDGELGASKEEAVDWLRRAAVAGEVRACLPLANALQKTESADEEVRYWTSRATGDSGTFETLPVPPAVRKLMKLERKKEKPPAKTESLPKPKDL